MAIARRTSNIVNLGFVVVNEDEKAGVEINQSIVNGCSAGVSIRTINGARKSASIRLDDAAARDLHECLTEMLSNLDN